MAAEKVEKKTLDGWVMIQTLMVFIITLAATYAANQMSDLNKSVNRLNENMSSTMTGMSGQKETLSRHEKTLESHDDRIRTLETKFQ